MKKLLILLLVLSLLPGYAAWADQVFYRPELGKCGDVIPTYINNEFRVFFLMAGAGKWAYTTTADWVDYSPVTLLQDFGGTGDVFYHDGWYHLYAARAAQNGREFISHYCSKDLLTWNRLNESITTDINQYVSHAWRDPRVFWHEEEQKWWMLATTNVIAADSVNRNGCVALMTSDDLTTWTHEGPLYSPRRYEGSFECPDYFQIGDWYYLLYSCASDGKVTHYVKSRSPRGPWIVPDMDTLDSVFFYAAKTVSDGENRYAVGWAGERINGTAMGLGLSGSYIDDDYASVGYGGSAIVHRIVQGENGDLYAAPVHSILESLDTRYDLSMQALTGEWMQGDSSNPSVQVTAQDGQAVLKVADLPRVCRVSFKVRGDAKEMGFALHAPDSLTGGGYYYTLDRGRQQLTYTSGGRTNGNGYSYPFDGELSRSIAVNDQTEYQVEFLVDDDITVVYINDQIALTARHASAEASGLYLTCYGGNASFTDIAVWMADMDSAGQ